MRGEEGCDLEAWEVDLLKLPASKAGAGLAAGPGSSPFHTDNFVDSGS